MFLELINFPNYREDYYTNMNHKSEKIYDIAYTGIINKTIFVSLYCSSGTAKYEKREFIFQDKD